jgi:hypothetical protein
VAKAGGSGVPGQPGLHSETCLKTKQTKNPNKPPQKYEILPFGAERHTVCPHSFVEAKKLSEKLRLEARLSEAKKDRKKSMESVENHTKIQLGEVILMFYSTVG